MANTVKMKRSAVQGKVPVVGDLALGELALNTYDGKLYTKKDDGAASVVEFGKAIAVSATAPSSPGAGDLWYDTEDARTFIWTGSEWADSSPDAGFPTAATGDNAPASPESGDLWYRTSDGRMYVYYNDGNTSQWVDTNPNTTPVNDTFERNGTDVELVNTGDNVGIGTTPAVKLDVNGEIRASAGILFGADTAAANTLDDYEEGTWTPVIAGGTTAGTYTYDAAQTGRYTKIGRQVTVTCSLGAVTATSAGSGNLLVTGLPFTSNATQDHYGTAQPSHVSFNASTIHAICRVLKGTSEIQLRQVRDNTNPTSVAVTDITSGSTYINYQLTYTID